VYAKEPDTLMNELTELAAETIESGRSEKGDLASIKLAIKNKLGEHIFKKSKRRPMILPIIMEV
jgi:ribonuclease J